MHNGVATKPTFCPAHGFWATDRCRLTPWDLLPPNRSANNSNQQLKRVTRDLSYVDGRRYSTHAFRRGSTQEIRNSGTTSPAIPKSGIWTSGGYKCYIYLRADEAVNISALLATALESDSDGQDIPPTALTTKNGTRQWGRLDEYSKNGLTRAVRPLTFHLPREGMGHSEPSESSAPSETSSATSWKSRLIWDPIRGRS